MKDKLLILAFIIISIPTFSQKKEKSLKYSGFSGGMLLHVGYVQSKCFVVTDNIGNSYHQKLNGLGYGIGGHARVRLGKHLRLGTEGYITKHKYKNNSYTSIGWGGILADCMWNKGKFFPFIGGTIGGGSLDNVTNLNKLNNNFTIDENVLLRKYSFFCLVPFVGSEFALKEHIHIVLKFDYIINVSNPQADFTRGPRMYFGFSFRR